jgi:hypothetical protein
MSCLLGAACNCRAGALRILLCEVRPLPFWEPVPAASAATLELDHISAALGADPINDRRDDPVVGLFWGRFGHIVLCRVKPSEYYSG